MALSFYGILGVDRINRMHESEIQLHALVQMTFPSLHTVLRGR
jgi:hypothetical protein